MQLQFCQLHGNSHCAVGVLSVPPCTGACARCLKALLVLSQARGRQAAAADDSDDAPETLHTRSAKPSKRAHASSFDDADDAPAEDPFYAQAAEAAKGRKKQKSSKYSAGPTLPPLTEPESEGPRKVSRAVEKNRGLTPHRRRDLKNPRVKVCQPCKPVVLSCKHCAVILVAGLIKPWPDM